MLQYRLPARHPTEKTGHYVIHISTAQNAADIAAITLMLLIYIRERSPKQLQSELT